MRAVSREGIDDFLGGYRVRMRLACHVVAVKRSLQLWCLRAGVQSPYAKAGGRHGRIHQCCDAKDANDAGLAGAEFT